jgi:hypothetical protein
MWQSGWHFQNVLCHVFVLSFEIYRLGDPVLRKRNLYPNTNDRTGVKDIWKENIATDTIYGPTKRKGTGA